jgi:FkbM family methyltransferase
MNHICLAFLFSTCVANSLPLSEDIPINSSLLSSQWSRSEFYGKIGKNPEGYYSQWGQDKFMNEEFFHNKPDGIFIDIGAHNGISYSNTKFFEELGWKGICIEPIPEVFKELKRNRKAHCLQGCISNFSGIAHFGEVVGNSQMLSGLVEKFDPIHQTRIVDAIHSNQGSYKVIEVNCYLLNDILQEYGFSHIDYLTLDTEGGELDILQSIDFSKFNIDFIDVENNYGINFREFLISKGYRFVRIHEDNELYQKIK